MSPYDIGAILVMLTIFAAPLAVMRWWFRRFRKRRADTIEDLEQQGLVGTFELPIIVGVLIGGLGVFLAGAGLLPLLVWIVDGDTEARRAFFSLVIMGGAIAACGWLAAIPGLRYWVVDATSVWTTRFERRNTIDLADVTALREKRTVTGAIDIESATGRRIRVPHQLAGFDEFIAKVRSGTSGVPITPARIEDSPTEAPERRDAYGISKLRVRATIGGLAAFLLFFWVGPWLVVNGEHPTRDAIIFMGIGTFIWAAFAGLLMAETFPRRQPSHLEFGPTSFRYRLLTKPWVTVENDEIYSASVETRIRYVKGMPGYLHPLVITFIDGSSVEIDVIRAKHMGASTQHLGSELRRRYLDPTSRTHAQRSAAAAARERAEAAESAGDLVAAVNDYRVAIASDPSPSNRALYRHVGDLLRRLDDHEAAVSSYRAHIDFSPDDHLAWEGLSAALVGAGRSDSASEASAHAERILLSRSG